MMHAFSHATEPKARARATPAKAESVPFFQPKPIQRKCADCEKEEKAQRKESPTPACSTDRPTPSPKGEGSTAPPIVTDVLSSGDGRSMDNGTRQFMESRFGQDFSQVRIHTDGRAAESAGAIQARAYTSGRDIVFGAGEYQPGSESGKRLLAHELAHVRQQNGDKPGQLLFRKVSFAENKPMNTINPANNIENGIPNMGRTLLSVNGKTSWKGNPFSPPSIVFDDKSSVCSIAEPTNAVSYETHIPIDKEWVAMVDKSWVTDRTPGLKDIFEAKKCPSGQMRIIVQTSDRAKTIQEIADHEKKHAKDKKDIYSTFIEPWDKDMAKRVAGYSKNVDKKKCAQYKNTEKGLANAMFAQVAKEDKDREIAFHDSPQGKTKTPQVKKLDCNDLIYKV